MSYCNCCVLPKHQMHHRLANDVGSAYDNALFACNIKVGTSSFKKLNDTCRSAGNEAIFSYAEFAHIDRMETVHILVGSYRINNSLLIDMLWKRHLYKNTVNVFAKGHGKYQRGKINVCFYPAEQQPYIIINIRESLQITDEAEMEAVLEVIAESEGYDADEYGTIPFMKAQWIAHNIAHSMANGNENQKKLVETIAGESISSIAGRSKELDLSPYASMPEREILLYQILELALFGNGH